MAHLKWQVKFKQKRARYNRWKPSLRWQHNCPSEGFLEQNRNPKTLCKEATSQVDIKKQGWSIVVGTNRNAGQETAIQTTHSCFYAHHMILVTAEVGEPGYGCYYGGAGVLYPRLGVLLDGVKDNELGLKSSKGLGRRVTEVAKLIKMGLRRS